MRVFLMHPDRDFDARSPSPEELTEHFQDLALDVLLDNFNDTIIRALAGLCLGRILAFFRPWIGRLGIRAPRYWLPPLCGPPAA